MCHFLYSITQYVTLYLYSIHICIYIYLRKRRSKNKISFDVYKNRLCAHSPLRIPFPDSFINSYISFLSFFCLPACFINFYNFFPLPLMPCMTLEQDSNIMSSNIVLCFWEGGEN